MVLAAPLLTLAHKGVVLGRWSKAGKYLLKILLCGRIACELMLSVTLYAMLNKASLSNLYQVFCIYVFRPSGHIFPQVQSSYHRIFYTGIFTLGMR